jgi:hypothetical protein
MLGGFRDYEKCMLHGPHHRPVLRECLGISAFREVRDARDFFADINQPDTE